MDIIIGGVRSANIKLLADYAAKNDIRLVVPFANKVDQVFNNPNIYQVNTPQSYLYSEAYEHFIRKFKGMNVIFLDTNNGDKDKNEFISGLKKELKDNRFTCSQMSINTQTTPEKLIAAMDTLSESIFIPLSGKNSALAQIFPALLQVRRSHPNIRMHLFGYPEWQTYTQEYLSWIPIFILHSIPITCSLLPYSSARTTVVGMEKKWPTPIPNMVCWDMIQPISS